jgi:hypothetical protein
MQRSGLRLSSRLLTLIWTPAFSLAVQSNPRPKGGFVPTTLLRAALLTVLASAVLAAPAAAAMPAASCAPPPLNPQPEPPG